jgi:hypothetical protein
MRLAGRDAMDFKRASVDAEFKRGEVAFGHAVSRRLSLAMAVILRILPRSTRCIELPRYRKL